MADTERVTGTVKWFNPEDHYGFITTETGDVFVHQTDIQGEDKPTLAGGDRVELTIVQEKRGPRAQDVVRLTD